MQTPDVKKLFICPKCNDGVSGEEKSTELEVKGMSVMFQDTLSINVGCKECGTIWRTYIKASEVNGEVIYVKPDEKADEAPAENAN